MNTILHYQNRINLLSQRDPVRNYHLIQKLKRKVRILESGKF